MIISKTARVYICNSNISTYRNKGYDVKNKEYCEIKIEDLPKGSNVKIWVSCDYCGKIYEVIYNDYNRHIKNNPKTCCKDCTYLKHQEVIIDKYGVDNICYLEDVIDKKKRTNIEKYGCEYSVVSNQSNQKRKATNLLKYGTEHAIASDIVQNKIKKANREKYGTDYPLQNKDQLKFINDSAFKKYKTRLFTKNVSESQKLINSKLNGVLNYYLDGYYIDIFLDELNMAIEYDGGGHNLSVKMGKISEEEFAIRERNREKVILNNGINILRIINYNDIKISDELIDAIKEIVFNYNDKYNICDYYVESGIVEYR